MARLFVVRIFYKHHRTFLTLSSLYGSLGIIAGSIPMMKPLVAKVLGMDSTQDHSYYAYGSNNNNPSHLRTIGGTYGNGTRGGGNRSQIRRGNGTVVDETGFEMDERDSDRGGSLASDPKSDDINSVSVYRHNDATGSQENILYYVPGVSNKTTIENGNVNPNHSLNGTPGGGTGSAGSRLQQLQRGDNNFRGIKMTTEVSVKR